MKPFGVAMALLLALGLTACGSSSSTSTQKSGFGNRAFVTNTFSGTVNIVNASTDAVSPSSIAVSTQPTIMAVAPNHSLTLVFNSAVNTVSVINNSSESVSGAISLPSSAQSMVAKDSVTGYAALPNDFIDSQSPLGAVLVLNLSSFTVSNTIAVPGASRLVLSHNGAWLLAFSNGSDSVTLINTSTNVAQTVHGFDRPVYGVFTADDSTAFIMNCGPECGGSQAGVQPLTIASATAGTAQQVSAATVGLLSGSTLFVAGTKSGTPGQGVLNVLDTGSMSVTKADLPIGDGYHTLMTLGSNNKLVIGSVNCTNDPNSPTHTGCVTLFDTSTSTPVIDTARDPVTCPATGQCSASKGSVTGMAAVPNRSEVYVVEGNVLRVFDTTTSSEIVGKIQIFGQVSDVKLVDQ